MRPSCPAATGPRYSPPGPGAHLGWVQERNPGPQLVLWFLVLKTQEWKPDFSDPGSSFTLTQGGRALVQHGQASSGIYWELTLHRLTCTLNFLGISASFEHYSARIKWSLAGGDVLFGECETFICAAGSGRTERSTVEC